MSSLPQNSVPSGERTGEDSKKLPAVYVQFTAPVPAFRAYITASHEPTYSRPSTDKHGDEVMEPPVAFDHTRTPIVLTAYTAKSVEV